MYKSTGGTTIANIDIRGNLLSYTGKNQEAISEFQTLVDGYINLGQESNFTVAIAKAQIAALSGNLEEIPTQFDLALSQVPQFPARQPESNTTPFASAKSSRFSYSPVHCSVVEEQAN